MRIKRGIADYARSWGRMTSVDDLRLFKTVMIWGDWRFSTGFARVAAPKVRNTVKKDAMRENNIVD